MFFPGYSIAIGIVSIMFAVSGIILGIGIALQDKKITEIGKIELYQSAINGAIVGALVLAFYPGGLISGVMSSITYNAGVSTACSPPLSINPAICFAHNYLVGISPVSFGGSTYPSLLSSVLTLLVPISALYGIIATISGLKVSIVLVSIGFTALAQPVLTQLNYIITALSITLLSLEIQGILLEFVAAISLSILLPVGIILRAFYFTRRLGGAILAISIALFTVLPLSYLLDVQLVSTYSSGSSVALNQSIQNSTRVQQNVLAGLNSANLTTGSATSVISEIGSLFSGLT
ncbi:conserved hypothetical protein, membrane, partial [mine drainage metagenome]